MKKILLFASAIAGMILAGSCQRETLEPEQMASTVKFTVEAPGAIDTKTIADGLNVDVVHYAVYKTNSDETHAIEVATERPLAQGFVPMSNKRANINFDLLQDQYYTIIFWAQVSQDENGQNNYYELGDLRAISMKKDAENNIVGNEEERAAFFAWYSFDTNEHKDHVVTLKRPFAQLNLLTTLESLKPVSTGQTSGYEVAIERSTVTVEGLTSTFYPYAKPVLENTQGNANETNETFTFTLEATPAVQGIGEGDNGDLLHVNGKAYHYVSMNYFFVPLDQYTVNVSYVLDTDKGNVNHAIAAVPVKKNYRTNVIGNLLTKESKFEIIVDAEFGGQNLVDVWDGREVSEPAIVDGKYVISTAAELAWLAAAVNGTLPPVAVNGVAQPTPKAQKFSGKTFMLLEDINLANPSIELPNVTWTPIGATGKFEGTFDGNGKTIYGLKVVAEGKAPAGLFDNAKYVKNVTVDGAQITGQYKTGVIVGNGLCSRIDNCHVINSTVTVTPYNQDEANNVGGIVGYLSAENEAWVRNCTVENTRISAYRKVGGIAGTANQAAVVTGNTVKNSFVIADQTPEYKEAKAADLGAIVGYVHAKATVADNTAENVELTHKVNSVEELNDKVKDAYKTLGAGEYNLTGDVTVKDKPIQVKEGEVIINGTDYTITAGSEGHYAMITNGADASLVIDAKVASLGGGVAAANGAKVVFNGQGVDISQYTKSSPARYNFYASTGGEIVINSGTFKFNSTNNTRRAYVCVEAGGKVIINGGTFGKASTRDGYTGIRVIDDQSEVIVKGGTFGFDPSEWVKVGYVAVKNGTDWTVEPADQNAYVLNADGSAVAYSQAGLAAAINDGKLEIALTAGTYSLPKVPAGLELVGLEDNVVLDVQNKVYGVNDGAVSFENITLKYANANYKGFQHTSQEYYKDCTIIGQPFLYGETVVFEGCTFEQESAGAYNVWTYGAKNVEFNKCTFNSAGKAVLVYNEKGHVHNVTFNECVLNASAPADGKAAVEIDSSFPNGGTGHYTVNFISTSANGFAEGNVSGNTLWNNKKGDNATVIVDGVTVLE